MSNGSASMELESITLTPSTPHIGAEVGNVDLTKTLSNRQVQEVYEALLKYQVIFFRDQPINFEQHTDQSCAEVPPLGSILYQKVVPPDGGGDTMFASMYAAYDAPAAGPDWPK